MERLDSIIETPSGQPLAAHVLPLTLIPTEFPLPFAEPLPLPAVIEPVPLVRMLAAPTASRRLAESLILFVSTILFLRNGY